jgi:hypothetical protein
MAPTLTPDRQTFRQAVAAVAAKAHEKLPEHAGRIDSAVKLVLAGDVELLPDGTATVASRSDASRTYTRLGRLAVLGQVLGWHQDPQNVLTAVALGK